MSHRMGSNHGAQDLAVNETYADSGRTADTGAAVSASEPESLPSASSAGVVSLGARLLELSLGGGVWLKGDDLADGTLPAICCLTGETPIVMRPYWFKNPHQWRYQGWWSVGTLIGANLLQPNSFRVRTLLPVGDRALKRRKLTSRCLVVLASATLPLLFLAAVLGVSLETNLMELSLLPALLGLTALVGTALLFVVYVAGVGLPRGTAHLDGTRQVHVLLRNPHPAFAAAVREKYGRDYSRLGPYARSASDYPASSR